MWKRLWCILFGHVPQTVITIDGSAVKGITGVTETKTCSRCKKVISVW